MKLLKMLSSKKGQFYILIALLLISYAFALSRQDVPQRRPKDTFEVLHEGYIAEGSVVVNSAVYDEANVSDRFASFTNSYLSFARSGEPSFRLAYLLKHRDGLTVGNRLDAVLNVSAPSQSFAISPGSEQTIPVSRVTVRMDGIGYDFDFSGQEIELKAVFRASDRLSRRVFVYK